ncbi:hypothetical protein BC937DRAFT_90015 [Endogone sp. FLAS-F59071]|nr:hypothetical protein BC937DRAFT_90015 [Endogone sp. FLAS-F59071]|eukprot:RUS17401.1 hypothetical protein BC937DRAFT_90015 [Endogone sp. FLAS-F59071]
MTVYHAVLVKIKPDADPTQVEAMLTGFASLKNDIPQVQKFSGGANFSQRAQGFEHDIYIGHQAHIAFRTQKVVPVISDILVFDYEAE